MHISMSEEDSWSNKERLRSKSASTSKNSKGKKKDMEQLIQELTTTVNSLKEDMKNSGQSKSSLSDLKTDCEQIHTQCKSDSMKIKLLTAIVIKQNQKIDELSEEVARLKKDNKKPNIKIDGLLEREAEKTNKERIKVVEDFLKEQMELEQKIPIKQAYRIGSANPHTMMVVVKNPDDKYTIFSNAKKLAGKSNARKQLFYVNNDLMDDELEQKKYYRELIKENKSKEEENQLQISLKKGKLFANNKIIKQELNFPDARDVLTLSDEELAEVQKVKTYLAGTHEEDQSDFHCYFQRIANIRDVQNGVNNMKIKFGDSTHIVTAYRLENPAGPFNQSFLDDGEPGTGRAILQCMKEKEMDKMAIFIVRYYGGKKMGKRRFEIYRHLAKQAVQQLKAKLDRLSRSIRQEKDFSRLSQSSITSSFSQSEEQDINGEQNNDKEEQKEQAPP